jgi:hypothetical protein
MTKLKIINSFEKEKSKSFFLSFFHSFPDLEIMSLTISMKSIAEQQLCCSIRRRRRSWNHFRLFLNLSITPGVAKQVMHKPRNQSGQNYIVFVPHASSEWYLRCVKFFFSHLECPEMTL